MVLVASTAGQVDLPEVVGLQVQTWWFPSGFDRLICSGGGLFFALCICILAPVHICNPAHLHSEIERLFSCQEEGNLAAAAPGETLAGPGLAIAGDLETAVRALDAPAKLQQIPVDLSLRTTVLLLRRLRRLLRRRRGGYEGTEVTVTLSRAASSSPVSFSLGLDRPSSEFLLLMFPPGLSFPWSGSRNRRHVDVHGPAFRALRTVFSLTSRSCAIFRPDAPASFIRLASCTCSSVRERRRPNVWPRALAAASPPWCVGVPPPAPGPPPTPPC